VSIKIYIGSLIEHGSERATLESVVQSLSSNNRSAVILANINLDGRQLDLVIGLDRLTLVIEAKGFSVPVRGEENGPWQYRVASGGWRNIPNLHLQTIRASHALRDAMSKHVGSQVGYPSAALVFTRSIPPGSSMFAGNFKAAIVGLDALDGQLQRTSEPQWTASQWRSFAEAHRLAHVENVEAAFDPQIAAAEQLIASYTTAFRRTYQPLTAELISFPCNEKDQSCQSDDVIQRGARGADLLLRGPSGCGKTLLGYRIGIDCIDQGRAPIFVRAKDFSGSLRDAVNYEAALLDLPTAEALIGACRRLDRALVLIVDGYNECSEALRKTLTRSVAAVSRRYSASIIVTAQSALELPELLELGEITIPEPGPTTKQAIAKQASADAVLDSSLDPLLQSVGSGLEARLIGEVGRDIPPEAGRYAIFDLFVRKRLGAQAVDGIRALARIAGLLLDRISFGLSVRDLGRYAEQEHIDSQLIQRLHETKLLVSRGERASFGHELFLNAFAAEAVIRRAHGNASQISAALRLPKHTDRKALIIGAIDDVSLLTAVLSESADVSVIQACLSGQCGPTARAWAERRCQDIINRARQEIAQVAFEIGSGFLNVRANPETLSSWNPQEKAVLAALPQMVAEGPYLDAALGLVAAMDQRLSAEHVRLREQASDQKVALRSGLFANCYVWGGPDTPAIATVCSPHHGWLFQRNPSSAQAAVVRAHLSRDDLTPGQLYLLLALNRRGGLDQPSIAPLLPKILRRHWRGAAYHLRLDLMDAARSAGWRATDDERRLVIAAIEELPESNNIGISSIMIDALKGLGALDDSESDHIEVVRSNFRDLCADQSNPDMQSLAFGVWCGQFDHPYDGAYCQVINELEPVDKKILLTMAARGANLDSPFVGILIMELAAFGDSSAGPLIARWVAPPPTQCFMPQDAIGAFAVAHIALGRLDCPVPDSGETEQSDEGKSLSACGRILYWLNRTDLSMPRRRTECAEALAVLMRHERGASVSVISEFYWAHTMWTEGLSRLAGVEPVHTSIGAFFPAEIAEVCRKCLLNPEPQRGYFDFPDGTRVLDFAISALAQWGNATDIPLLRQWSSDSRMGRSAINAVAKLEETGLLPARA